MYFSNVIVNLSVIISVTTTINITFVFAVNFNHYGNKINKFQNYVAQLRTLTNKTLKGTKLKLYNVMAIPTLLYASKCWELKKKYILDRRVKYQKRSFLCYRRAE